MTYYQRNKERIKAQQRDYYQKNRETILERLRANPDERKAYYQRNKERIKARSLAYYHANKQDRDHGTYYQRHKDAIQKRQKAWYEQNKATILQKQAERRRTQREALAAKDSRQAYLLVMGKLSPTLKATLRRRRLRERLWAKKVLDAGSPLAVLDRDYNIEVTITAERANEILKK